MRLSVSDWQRAARSALPRFVSDFIEGAADSEKGLDRNRAAFDEATLVPRVLTDTRQIDPTITLWGTRWAQPFAVAPMGLNGLVRPGGDLHLAEAAAARGIPFILSTASNARLEAVRECAPDAALWLQLYVMEDRTVAEQLLRRARAARFEALVLTVDVAVSGMRLRDVRNGFKVPFRPSPALLWDLVRHPAWSLRQAMAGAPGFVNLVEDPQAKLSTQAQAALLARSMDRSLDWTALAWLRRHWDGPLLLKGVLHPEDARLARQAGVDGLVVSNHGARQLDASPASLTQLPAIVDVVDGALPVLLDSGVRHGSDVAKALARGAAAVLIGRPALYGLAVAGQAGAQAVLSGIAEELTRTMTLLGACNAQALRTGYTA